MNKLITAVLLSLSLSVHASNKPSEAPDEDFCNTMYTIAKSIMEVRQAGMSMPKLMAIMKANNMDFVKPAIMAAYDQPRMFTESGQQQMIEEFGNGMYLGCLEGLG